MTPADQLLLEMYKARCAKGGTLAFTQRELYDLRLLYLRITKQHAYGAFPTETLLAQIDGCLADKVTKALLK